MAGKGYVSNASRVAVVAGGFPKPDYPGGFPVPDNDNPRPRVPWKPPRRRPSGVFPKQPKWAKPPFGKRPLVVYPDAFGPGRFPRIPAWAVVPAVFMVGGWFVTRAKPDFAGMGFTLCWDGGGPKEAFSSIYLDNCAAADFWKNLSFQVPGGKIGLDTPSNVSYGYAVGPYDNPEQTRMTYKELWARNYYNNAPFIMIPGATWVPDPLLPFSDPDPNLWLPLQPYTPPVPEPVYPPRNWPETDPRTYPRHVRGPNPHTDPKGNPKPRVRVRPKPNIKHDRRPPTRREHESKYSAARGSLAGLLLLIASKAYNGITEAFDLVSAIYKALPPSIIARMPDNLTTGVDIMSHMLAAIWTYRAQIDMREAIINIAENQIEDAAWGRYFKAVDNVSRKGPNYQGFDRELGYLNDLFKELQKETAK